MINLKIFSKKASTLIFLTFFIFVIRNTERISNEYEKYNYNPFKKAFYEVNQKHFRIEKKFQLIIERNYICKNNDKLQKCLNKTNKSYKKFGKRIIENN